MPDIDGYDLAVAIMAEQWRILVVEGEEKLNWNIVNSLQKDGYLVLGVTGGAEAIRTLWSEEYDVVICSQRMPDADGFDLLQWMRTYCPNSRMIMLGAPGNGLNRAQALEMGVTSYLEKPLDLRALKEELRRLLHQTGFSASLDSFDLLDVIQIINMSRKSIALVVNTGLEEQGTLRFQTGELIWSEYGILRGEEAFFALAAHKNGTVVHRPWNDQITPNVTQPLSRLIFQALQYRSKYAERQQLSSEIEEIRPHNMVPDPPTLPPLPPTTLPGALQSPEEDDSPFQFDEEEDDSPFQFVAENTAVEQSPASPFAQMTSNGSTNGYLEQGQGSLGTIMNTEPGAANSPVAKAKAWWEPTGSFPKLQISGQMRAITDNGSEQALSTNNVNITPSAVHKTGMGQTSSLPSWLTDQPTNLGLPVLRGNTGQMPAVPQERSPVPPRTPPTSAPVSPAPSQDANAKWPRPALNPSDSGLRKMNPEDSSLTTPRRAVKPNITTQPSGPLRLSPAEWQSPMPALPPGQSGQMEAIKPFSGSQGSGHTLQSLAALKKNNTTTPVEKNGATPAQATQIAGSPVWEPATGVGTSEQSKRNYPALAAALQTLGYSVPGFVAAAVVSLEGTPIAQVAMDETDISPLCAHLSGVVRGALQALGQGNDQDYEHIVITSRTQHILLRLIDKKKDVFQALITLRDTDPAQGLEVMINVEAALAAAL